MMALETWVATPLAGAVGWALLHSLWEGALIAALAAVLVAARSPRIRYAAACTAMLLMLAGFGVTLVRMLPQNTHAARAVRPPAFPRWSAAPDVDVAAPPNSGLAAIVPWLAPFWIAGVWIFYLRQAAGWISVCRLRRRGVCSAPERWQNELARLSAQLRVSRPIALLESAVADAPMVLGHFRPLILVPAGVLAGLPAGQVEAILLHELAHIRRCDYLVNVLQRSLEGLLFYHPAVWWISHVIRTERENCCDDVAVAVSGNAHEYAVALSALEQNRWSGPEPAVAATGGSLVKRIRRLLYPKGPNSAWTPLVASAVLIFTTAAALAAWPAAPPQRKSADTQPLAEQAAASPYTKWLNEDVVYIIDDAERAAFKRLTTDEERDQFIKQFWQRRDPTTGTEENEFKIEHYRRIAYANEHFRNGWKSDRGHMYIVYGPPDEIESHPTPSGKAYAFEVWMYHHVEGVGDRLFVTFIDRSGTGDYRLAPGNAR